MRKLIEKTPLYCWGGIQMESAHFSALISNVWSDKDEYIENKNWVFSGKRFYYIHEALLYGRELCKRYNRRWGLTKYG